MVCPEGNENWSGGSRLAQQCGSISHGRLRPDSFFNKIKMPTPARAAEPAAAMAVRRPLPPNSKMANPTEYHPQPSPAGVAAISKKGTERGAGHLVAFRSSL